MLHRGESWGERDLLEELGVEERIILNCIFKKWEAVMGWIHLAQYTERQRALVNAVMKFQIT